MLHANWILHVFTTTLHKRDNGQFLEIIVAIIERVVF